MFTEADRAIAATFALQRGVVSRRQALGAGMTAAQLRVRVESGAWDRVAPSVYALNGCPDTWMRRLWTAHLHAGPDSVVSHESAGRLHHFRQVPAGIVALTVPERRRFVAPGVRVHRTDRIGPADVVEIEGLPVTAPARTVVDLASRLSLARLRLLVEDQAVSRQIGLAALGAALGGVRARGRSGVGRLALVLDELGPADGIPRSELERLLDEVVALAGLPEPSHEYPLPGRGARTGFVDRCWAGCRLILEADGRAWHSRRSEMLADADRSLQAQEVGFQTTRLLWEHLSSDPVGTARSLAAVHRQRTTECIGPGP